MASNGNITISAAVRLFDIRRDRLRRLLADGEIEGAYRREGEYGSEWVFPASSLEALGFERRETNGNGKNGNGRNGSGRPGYVIPVALLTLLTIVLVAVAVIAGGGDDDDPPEQADPTPEAPAVVRLLADATEEGDDVGVIGDDAAPLVPEDREIVVLDADDLPESLPRYVLGVGGDDVQAVVDDVIAQSRGELLFRGQVAGAPAYLVDTAPGGTTTTDAPSTTAEPSTTDPESAGPDTTDTPDTTETPDTTDSPATTDPTTTEAPSTTEAPTTTAAPTTTEAPTTTAPPTTTTEPPVEDPPAVDPPRADPDGGTYEVVVGDHFWSIATDLVLDVDPDADLATITGYWAELIDANSDRLVEPGNPDLILPGQTFVIPPVAATIG